MAQPPTPRSPVDQKCATDGFRDISWLVRKNTLTINQAFSRQFVSCNALSRVTPCTTPQKHVLAPQLCKLIIRKCFQYQNVHTWDRR
ncbi:hypothetical protein BofuT4_uP042160.1 [Botrytis cinerea T4]|uniref:Uncharacterized protein n=1 Tax=Botryotinia fuckeliana (strain T4) TaxID=999810 RepID=G2Y1R5_BOTF4|nr:hypothetical protein BofuT4_uP042160.1 [Botrytis cinerea T4]